MEREKKRKGRKERGWKRARSRPHTFEKLQHADDKEGSAARERRKIAREKRPRGGQKRGGGWRRGAEFILRAFFYRSLTPHSPL